MLHVAPAPSELRRPSDYPRQDTNAARQCWGILVPPSESVRTDVVPGGGWRFRAPVYLARGQLLQQTFRMLPESHPQGGFKCEEAVDGVPVCLEPVFKLSGMKTIAWWAG